MPVEKAKELTRLALKILQFVSIVNGFKGDSGGPLTIEENGIHTLAGITSHGFSTNYVKVEFKQTNIPQRTSIYAYKQGSLFFLISGYPSLEKTGSIL